MSCGFNPQFQRTRLAARLRPDRYGRGASFCPEGQPLKASRLSHWQVFSPRLSRLPRDTALKSRTPVSQTMTLQERPGDSQDSRALSTLPFPAHLTTDSPAAPVALLWRRTTFVPWEFLPTLARLRQEAADEIDRLVGFLDATETDVDLEPSLGSSPHGIAEADLEGDECDNEPSLGSIEAQASQEHWGCGNIDDREVEPENDEDGGDDEWSLGSTNPTISGSQARWSQGYDSDLEHEHDGREEDDPEDLSEASGIGDLDGVLEQWPHMQTIVGVHVE
jgi:hypothetical protein